MQQRYYDPAIGRFLSVDPVSVSMTDGASFNRYAYAANNPYYYVDPDGREVRIRNEVTWVAEGLDDRAAGTVTADEDGFLQITDDGTGDGAQSSTYAEALRTAINDDNLMQIFVTDKYVDPNGNEVDIDAEYSGALTEVLSNGDVNIFVTPQNWEETGADGLPLMQDFHDKLMHEIPGHGLPGMGHPGTGNAVDNENQVRSEVPGMRLRQRVQRHREN